MGDDSIESACKHEDGDQIPSTYVIKQAWQVVLVQDCGQRREADPQSSLASQSS